MATITLGTAATNTLTAIQWTGANSPADIAAINLAFKYQQFTNPKVNQSITVQPSAVIQHGMLWVPERGSILLYKGDYIAVDPNTGHFVLINAATGAAASWVHT